MGYGSMWGFNVALLPSLSILIDSWREVVLNCNEHHHHLLNLLGERYVHLYADSEYLYADSG